MEDFWRDDDFIIKKLKKSGQKEILNITDILRQKPLPEIKSGAGNAKKKFRFVDPEFLSRGGAYRLSSVSVEFSDILKQAREHTQRGILF